MEQDKRRSERVAATFKVEYASFDKFLIEYAEDISQGGIFLATELFLPLGTVVRLVLHLPETAEAVHVIGQVVHHRGATESAAFGKRPGMGVEFLDIESEALRRVRVFVEARVKPAAERARTLPVTAARRPTDVLIAAPQEALAQLVVRALGVEFKPRLVSSGMRALAECIQQTPRLIVAAAELPELSGVELLRVVRERSTLAAVPFVLVAGRLDAEERLGAYREGVDDVVVLPVSEAELRARVDRILLRASGSDGQGLGDRRALRGEIGLVSIASLFGLLEMERKSGYLLLVREGETALVGFRAGRPVRADVRPTLEGKHKIFYVLDWTAGRFEFAPQDVGMGDEIDAGTQHLLVEHAQRTDEAATGGGRTGP